MKISGFTMSKNASKLYYPVKQSIQSILPIVDEFVVALGDCDEDDKSREEIERIGSSKIKIIDTVWDIEKYPRGMEHAHQTDIAKNECTGDWLFYLQSDEVIHEKDHPAIVKRCEQLLDDKEIEGLLFKYLHFYGDYDHYQFAHGWYNNEIRIIRNDPEIHSWESAQSFRRIPDFDGKNYRQQEGTHKLKVARVNAHVYHYGWVKPPVKMNNKVKAINTNHKGKKVIDEWEKEKKFENLFDYGNLSLLAKFKGTHPVVMKDKLAAFDWKDQLRYTGGRSTNKLKSKQDRFKYRMLTFIENNFLGGRRLGQFKNYILKKR